ncbi:MAG TPA: hypothetical protein PKJ56_10030, partial [Promineifilum sp.]|nr:hypothetical protein [Promineifilum sp.]
IGVIAGLFLIGYAPLLAAAWHDRHTYGATLAYNETFSRCYAANVQGYLLPGSYAIDTESCMARYWPASSRVLTAGVEGRTYISPVLFLVAVIGLIRSQRRKFDNFISSLIILAFLLSLGPSLQVGDFECFLGDGGPTLLIYRYFVQLPFCGGIRVPSRFCLLVLLGISLLAATGADRLRVWLSRCPLTPSIQHIVITGLLTILLAVSTGWSRAPAEPIRVEKILTALLDDQSRSSVLNLPLSWSSGQICLGEYDTTSMKHYAFHRKPIIGGHCSRYPRAIFAKLLDSPLTGTIMRMQLRLPLAARTPAEEFRMAQEFARGIGLKYIVVDLKRFDERALNRPGSEELNRIGRYLTEIFDINHLGTEENLALFEIQELNPQISPEFIQTVDDSRYPTSKLTLSYWLGPEP